MLFAKKEKRKKIVNEVIDVLPEGSPFILSEDKKFVCFGAMAQTVATPRAVAAMNEYPDENGFYRCRLDDSLYARVVSCPSGLDYTFADGSPIGDGSYCFFRVEPINWRILRFENGGAFLLSEKLLDCGAFLDLDLCVVSGRKDQNGFAVWTRKNDGTDAVYANCWHTSSLRERLNSAFLSKCFSTAELSHILDTENDNSATVKLGNGQVNTIDKVFLLSDAEVTNPELGFSPDVSCRDSARQAVATDFARARGLGMRNGSDCGYWWLRTAGYSSYNAARVFYDGYVNTTGRYVHYTDFGIRPAIKVKF